jgi:hypothetical protein
MEEESWFLEGENHERMWCVSVDEVPTRMRPTMATSDTMLTMFLTIRCAIVINWLPPGGKFNSNSFCQQRLEQLA